MTTIEYCPKCQGRTGTAGFFHEFTCPYNPLSNVTWSTFQPIPETDNILKDILDKLNEILKLMKEEDLG